MQIMKILIVILCAINTFAKVLNSLDLPPTQQSHKKFTKISEKNYKKIPEKFIHSYGTAGMWKKYSTFMAHMNTLILGQFSYRPTTTKSADMKIFGPF